MNVLKSLQSSFKQKDNAGGELGSTGMKDVLTASPSWPMAR